MLGLCLLSALGTVGWQGGWVTVRPKDTGEALVNPGMGWVLHYDDNIPENYGSRLQPSDTVDDFPSNGFSAHSCPAEAGCLLGICFGMHGDGQVEDRSSLVGQRWSETLPAGAGGGDTFTFA